jgi:eukaryotic-like serine/threonine-protein kinase
MPTNPFNVADIDAALGKRYGLGHELRVGGQGVVYRATRVLDADGKPCNNDVALKLHLDSKQDERVEREINAAKNLQHPSLATLLEEGTITVGTKQTRYIAWDFIRGEPLDAKLSKGALNEGGTVRIVRDVCAAIDVLWSKRIVHRDVAPKNIIVRADGSAVLIDLGGARHLDHTTITAPGYTFGTPGYFSPEQCRAEHALTSASDIFALGIVALECLLGRHPTGNDQHRLLTSPPSAKSLVQAASTELLDAIDAMLQLRAAFRPLPNALVNKFDQMLKVK